MANPLIQEFNSKTGESVIRGMNAVEFERYEAAQAAQVAEAETAATQKAALLARLGITADEARILLGQ